MFNGTDCGNITFNPAIDTTLAIAPHATPPHKLHALVATSISLLASTSEQPSLLGVMWKPPTLN
jgi:hypothetical protein